MRHTQMGWRPETGTQLWQLWEQCPSWQDPDPVHIRHRLLPTFSRLAFACMLALELVTRNA
jgi:hypothetical protein